VKIDSLQISNFKLFADRTFYFHPEFNLVIGANGGGKTSVLRAVAVALGGWAHAYIKDRNNRRQIGDDEVREIQQEKRFDRTKSVTVEAEGSAAIVDRYGKRKTGRAIWKRRRLEGINQTVTTGKIDYGTGKLYDLNFQQLGHDILTHIEGGNQFDLPLIAFYECDRLWLPKHDLKTEESAKAKYSRFDPYVDCFHTGADHKAVGEWLLKHELASLQKKEETPVLQSIRNAARAALEGCAGLRFDFEESRVLIEYEDGRTIPFEHLSDGQRTMLGLFCDLARRAAVLNPHLGGEASALTSGVVLIDELDLHLHPRWQRRIIEDLRRTFPKIQFICTTHSPFVIQSLRSGEELIMLDGQPTADVGHMPVEEIAQGLMGVNNTEVSQEYEHMKQVAKRYLETLEEAAMAPEEKQQAFQDQLAAAIAPYAHNPAYQAFLEMKRAAKLGE
jgi:predicted ATP-binding protein involved in virulence